MEYRLRKIIPYQEGTLPDQEGILPDQEGILPDQEGISQEGTFSGEGTEHFTPVSVSFRRPVEKKPPQRRLEPASLDLSLNGLVNGIIYSEILGSPASKKGPVKYHRPPGV